MGKSNVETKINGATVIYKRYYDAPIDLVFEAWSDPKHLAEWWGPDGFTLTTNSIDFSNGGVWDFIMHGPDGTDFKNRVQFLEIDRPNKLMYKHLGVDGDTADVNFHTVITFERSGEGTNLTMVQDFFTEEQLNFVNDKYGAIEGGIQHAENLAKYLATLK